jgi:putative transposase
MQLVEQHRIDRHDPRWRAIDEAAFASKNLYNAVNYLKRQAFIHEQRIVPLSEVYHAVKETPEYRALPAKVANWVLQQVFAAWSSYFAACQAYQETPVKFLGHPKLPGYLAKDGRNLVSYEDKAFSRNKTNAGLILPSGLDIRVQTNQPRDRIAMVRIVPKATHYVVEVIYATTLQPSSVQPNRVASIDIGVNNLAAITSNKPGFRPLLVNGRPLKSLNQHYNKTRARRQQALPGKQETSHFLDHLTDHRTRAIQYYLHVASRAIIALLVKEGIGTVVIGKNVGWKQEANMSKRNNQNFVFIPHARFISMLQYKASLVGIQTVLVEESHTSKCSFLDLELVGHHDRYVGKRVKRGLFRSASGQMINADVNGSYNIMRRAVPSVVEQGVLSFLLTPTFLSLPDRKQDRTKQRPTSKKCPNSVGHSGCCSQPAG